MPYEDNVIKIKTEITNFIIKQSHRLIKTTVHDATYSRFQNHIHFGIISSSRHRNFLDNLAQKYGVASFRSTRVRRASGNNLPCKKIMS